MNNIDLFITVCVLGGNYWAAVEHIIKIDKKNKEAQG